MRIAINGFGRIGRLVFRLLLQRSRDFEVVVINDLASIQDLGYLLQYDSVHGRLPYDVSVQENSLLIDNCKKVLVLSQNDPHNLPWKELSVDVVIESTGLWAKEKKMLEEHVNAGARHVVVTAPNPDIPMYVMGVNHACSSSNDKIVSMASCTTNCLAVIVKVLCSHFGWDEGFMTTVHAATSSQKVVDGICSKELRRGRSIFNIIPSSTGATKSVGRVVPEVNNRLTGMAFRVPIIDVSVVDLVVRLKYSTSVEEISACMRRASQNELHGILQCTNQPVVSSDFIGSPFSAVYDETATMSLGDRFYKIIAWYDNELGYGNRVVDWIEYYMKNNCHK